MTGDRDLDELNMKVSMAKTIEQAELTELEQLTLLGLEQTACQEAHPLQELPATLFSPTTGFTEATTGTSLTLNKKTIAPTSTSEEGISLPKVATLYSTLSDTVRSTATYLEETLGFASSQSASSAGITTSEDESNPL
jgi:hypothetical protein